MSGRKDIGFHKQLKLVSALRSEKMRWVLETLRETNFIVDADKSNMHKHSAILTRCIYQHLYDHLFGGGKESPREKLEAHLIGGVSY